MASAGHVLLVQPIIGGITQATPDLGLAYLATALRAHGYDVTILDCVRERFCQDDFLAYLQGKQFYAVGFKLFSLDMPSARRMMASVRTAYPDALVIAGGPHVSADPQAIFSDFPDATYAFHGEVQDGLPQLLNGLGAGVGAFEKLRQIPGLIYRDGVSTRVNPTEQVDDIDHYGLPAWDLIDPRWYVGTETLWPFAHRGGVVAPISVVSGCPFFCTYCAAHTLGGRRVRFRKIDQIIKELEWLRRDFGVGEFHIIDDYFTVDQEFVKEFCSELTKRALTMPWCCPVGVRISSLNRDLVRIMEDAGCYGVAVGIESGSQRILDFIRKAITIEEIREKLDMVAVETKWLVTGFFILGFPTETREEILETIRLASALPIHGAAFSAFRVHKGTELCGYLQTSGELSDEELRQLVGLEFGYSPKGLLPNELRRLRRKAYWTFFAKPSRIWAQVRRMNSAAQFRSVVGKIRVKMFA